MQAQCTPAVIRKTQSKINKTSNPWKLYLCARFPGWVVIIVSRISTNSKDEDAYFIGPAKDGGAMQLKGHAAFCAEVHLALPTDYSGEDSDDDNDDDNENDDDSDYEDGRNDREAPPQKRLRSQKAVVPPMAAGGGSKDFTESPKVEQQQQQQQLEVAGASTPAAAYVSMLPVPANPAVPKDPCLLEFTTTWETASKKKMDCLRILENVSTVLYYSITHCLR